MAPKGTASPPKRPPLIFGDEEPQPNRLNGTSGSLIASRLQLVVLVALAGFGAWCGMRAYSDYVFEDAYITIRYAKNLATGNGFTFTPGEHVLGTTTPLLTLILALLGKCGMDLEFAADLVAAVSLFAMALLGGLIARKLAAPNAGILFALATVFGFARIYNYWGLETSLLIALGFGAVLTFLYDRPVASGMLIGLAFLTRYDAFLLAFAVFLAMWVQDRRVPWKPALASLAVVAPWLAFSTWYFGSPLPNTLKAKARELGFADYFVRSSRQAITDMWEILDYLRIGSTARERFVTGFDWILVAGLLFAIPMLMRRARRLWILPMYALGLMAGYAFIGPPLEFRWYLTPAVFGCLLLALTGWSVPMRVLRVPPKGLMTGTFLVVLVAAPFLPATTRMHGKSFTEGRIYENRIGGYRQAAVWIRQSGLEDVTIFTGEPGYMTYLSGNPVIDSAGLVTKGIYQHGPAWRRTERGDAIRRLEPGMLVANFPNQEAGYVLAFSGRLGKQVQMRQNLFEARFDRMRDAFGTALHPDPKRVLWHHPLDIDFDSGTMPGFTEAGGFLPYLGLDLQLTIGGKPVAEPVGFLYRPRPSYLMAAETPPFLVDFDWIDMRLLGTSPQNAVAQLVIGGQIVLQGGGEQLGIPPPKGGEFALHSWNVEDWKGSEALLRFVLAGGAGEWLAMDHIQSKANRIAVRIDDFDNRAYSDLWVDTFASETVDRETIARSNGVGMSGPGRVAASYHVKGKVALTSKPMRIEHDVLTFMLYDFGGESTAVHLIVDGRSVRSVIGERTLQVRPLTWDVKDLRGKMATLSVVDDWETDGHWIGIDDLRAFDR
ncbi:MAG TPA: hypothetical protein P5218_02090 [Planctomycetota bacterium]|nr:hypothetical protein [Planctomycetota bacterium]HRV80190.1 hypothetical protein [Planctomycetota bacterium]